MRCGICGGAMKVTKVSHQPLFVRRRRQCQQCGKAWTTREYFDGAWIESGGVVMPNSGARDENGRTVSARMRGPLVCENLLPGRRADEVAPSADQGATGRGCDAAATNGCADGMAEAVGEMIATTAEWLDIEDAMRGVMA